MLLPSSPRFCNHCGPHHKEKHCFSLGQSVFSVSILNRPRGQTVFKYKTVMRRATYRRPPRQAAFRLPLMMQHRVRQISGRKPRRKAAFCVPVGTRSTLRCKLKRRQRPPAVGRYLYALTKPRGDAALESGLAAAEGRVLCAEALIYVFDTQRTVHRDIFL